MRDGRCQASPHSDSALLAVAPVVVAVALVPVGARWGRSCSCTSTTTTRSPSFTDRIERCRRVAAQAPEYRKALDAMREKNGRRFFLKNTAANLAGAELQEQVRSAIETNGGRIHDEPEPGAEGRRTAPPDRRHRAVLRVDPGIAEDPARSRRSRRICRSRT